MNNFKDNFIDLLEKSKQQGISHTEIAKILGITKQEISNLKSGFNLPSIDLLIIIADYYDITVDELIGRKINSNSYSYTETIYQDNETNFKHIRKK